MEVATDIKALRDSLKGLPSDEAIEKITEYIDAHEGDADLDEAYTMRGMKYWGLQQRASAINDYLAAIRLNPDSKAVEALKATNDILDYYNTDLYNP